MTTTTTNPTVKRPKKSRSFIYSIVNVKINKTYGGSKYTVKVYEIINNLPKYIGSHDADTRGHKGEDSEAFTVIVESAPDAIKKLLSNAKSALKHNPNDYEAKATLKDAKNSGGYYFYYMASLGLSLKKI